MYYKPDKSLGQWLLTHYTKIILATDHLYVLKT